MSRSETSRFAPIALLLAAVILALGTFSGLASAQSRSTNGQVTTPPVIFLTRANNVISTYPTGVRFVSTGAFTQGGGVTATSSQGTVTYTAAMIDTESLVIHTATGATTANLPASSTLSAIAPTAGMSRKVCVKPITTGITFAGGTGTELNSASSTKFIVAGTIGCFDFIRTSTAGDFEVLMTSGL